VVERRPPTLGPDFVDVVHVFHHETRQYYMLERLWGDAKVTEVKDRKPTHRKEGS
jgi:hypothetical protein